MTITTNWPGHARAGKAGYHPMKHADHKKRRSFAKWAMPGQRTGSVTPKFINRTRPVRSYASMSYHVPAFLGMIKSCDRLLPRDVNRSSKGPAKIGSKGMRTT